MTEVRTRALETLSVDIQAPGPGRWQREAAHQVRPWGRFHREFFGPCFDAAMRRALADYGSLLGRLEMRQVGGWQYYRPRPVGAPERPRPLPPRPLFKLLLRLHPELRRRTHAASHALAERAWTHEVERWRGGLRDRFRAEIRRLQAVDPRSLDDAELRAHLDEVLRVYRDGADVHYHHVVANLIAVGDFLDQVDRRTASRCRPRAA